jgi:hypothetical protein
MMYKDFDIVVRVSAYTECELTDEGTIDGGWVDTTTDFDDVIEYIAYDGRGNSYWADELDGIKALIDEYYAEKENV